MNELTDSYLLHYNELIQTHEYKIDSLCNIIAEYVSKSNIESLNYSRNKVLKILAGEYDFKLSELFDICDKLNLKIDIKIE